MDFRNFILLEKLKLSKCRAELDEGLKNAPPGELAIERNGQHYKWKYIREDIASGSSNGSSNDSRKGGRRGGRTIPRTDRQLAEKLAVKHYLENRRSSIDKSLKMLEEFCNAYLDPERFAGDPYAGDPYAGNPEYIALTAPFLGKKQKRIEQWLSEPFESNPEFPERKTIPTLSGTMVRSKSEAIIADELFRNHIPFRYEQVLQLGDLKLYPDFTILDPVSLTDITIWEHFGMMDKPLYASNAKVKTGTYIDAKYIPGDNLILTYENTRCPIDINYVSMLIAYHFL